MQLIPVSSQDIKQAEKRVRLWLQQHDSFAPKAVDGIPSFFVLAYWTYSVRPFHSVYVNSLGRYSGILGFHIYDDGEVLLVSRESEEDFS